MDGSKYAGYYSIIHVSHKCVLIFKPGGERRKRRPTDGLKAKSESERGKLGRMVQRVSKACESAETITQHISALGDHQF